MTQPERVTIKVVSREPTHEEQRPGLREIDEAAPCRGANAAIEQHRQLSRPMADYLCSQRQAFLRRAAQDLLREPACVTGPDEPETRLALRGAAATIDLRRDEWPPE
jgi:hypothetical protein